MEKRTRISCSRLIHSLNRIRTVVISCQQCYFCCCCCRRRRCKNTFYFLFLFYSDFLQQVTTEGTLIVHYRSCFYMFIFLNMITFLSHCMLQPFALHTFLFFHWHCCKNIFVWNGKVDQGNVVSILNTISWWTPQSDDSLRAEWKLYSANILSMCEFFLEKLVIQYFLKNQYGWIHIISLFI